MRRATLFFMMMLSIVPAQAATATAHSASAINSRIGAPSKQVGTIFISKLKLSAPIFMGVTDAVFDKGVGQWPGTPSAGKNGNLVLGGHRTSANAPFLNINVLKSGDIISIVVNKKTFKYKVTGHSIVKPSAVWITKQTSTPTLTLFSCHPIGRVSQRYVVRAVLTK